MRLACLVFFAISFFISIATFKQFAGFKNTKPIGLWIIYIIWPLVCAVVYVVSQLILVFRTLEDRWPIGDIVFGTAFFVIAQVLMFGFSVTICNAIKHYIDGVFFFSVCILLSVMMIYKYWDSITVRPPIASRLSNALMIFLPSRHGLSSARIWSSRLVRKRRYGKSRTHYLRVTSTKKRQPARTTMDARVLSEASAERTFTRRVAMAVEDTHRLLNGINSLALYTTASPRRFDRLPPPQSWLSYSFCIFGQFSVRYRRLILTHESELFVYIS